MADDTSLPPSLGPTDTAPQASDMTFDRSKLDGDETTDESPKPAVSSSFFKPAVPASVKAVPATPKPVAKPAAAKPEPKPVAAKAEQPAAKPKPAAKSASATTVNTTKATPPSQPAENAGAPAAARPRPKKIPMWAQLLALVVVAGAVGHLIARSQTESTAPAATAKPKPPPPPKKTPTSQPTAVAPAPEPSAAPPPTAEPAPVPAPAKAADLSACVAKEIGATLPSDKLTFVCEEADANRGQRDMSTLLVTIEDADRDARTAWNKYGWYRMAKLQIVRTRCCGDAPPMAITEALSACGLAESLSALHEADRNKTSFIEPVKAYKKAVDCLFKANTMRMFGIIARPGEYQEDAFVNSLSSE